MDNKKLREIFEWLKDTKKLSVEGYIDEKSAEKIINEHIHLIQDNKLQLELMDNLYYDSDNSDYWIKKIVNEDNLIDFIVLMMKRKMVNKTLVEYLVKNFLSLSEEERKDFYSINFCQPSDKNEKVLMCGVSNTPWFKGVHHNISTLFYICYSEEELKKLELFQEVKKDMRALLPKEEHTLLIGEQVIFNNFNEIKEKWNDLELNENTTYQKMLASRFLHRGKLVGKAVMKQIDLGDLPIDFKINGQKTLVEQYINNTLGSISFTLKTFYSQNRNESDLKTKETDLNNMIYELELLQKYDLRFIDTNEITEKFKNDMILTSKDERIHKIYLETLLAIESLNKPLIKKENKSKI